MENKNNSTTAGVETRNIGADINAFVRIRDPFDRILIAQAQIENCTLVTNDPKIKRYKIKTVG